MQTMSSRRSRSSRSLTLSRSSSNDKNDSDYKEDENLLEQATTARRLSSLHDLELIQAMSAAATVEEDNANDIASRISSPANSTANSTANDPQEPEQDHSRRSSGRASTHAEVRRHHHHHHHAQDMDGSEYSEYEEDEFDPEWHARQNRAAALALLSTQSNAVNSSTRRSTSSITVTASQKPQQDATNIFANRRDLREVDQSVNLMDASTGNYEDPNPRQSNKRTPRRARRRQDPQPQLSSSQDGVLSNLMDLSSSMVDVFLDGSEVMSSFRRTLSREPNNVNHPSSLRRTGSNGSNNSRLNAPNRSHQRRRLFYQHNNSNNNDNNSNNAFSCWPSPPPTMIPGDFAEAMAQNCCKGIVILIVVLFVLLLAFPQGTFWIQEHLGMTQTENGTTVPLIPTVPFLDWRDQRLESLRNMILTHELTSKVDLYNPDSPQYQASLWLAGNDPAELTLAFSEEDGVMIEPQTILNRYVLATFYIAMQGPRRDDNDQPIWNESRWNANDGWMTEAHVCEWYGVECEGLNHIEHFNLTRNALEGTIPSELAYLSDLVLVDWSHNVGITGEFPDWMGESWSNLEYLVLTKTGLQGRLPASIGGLTRLQELILTHADLDGELPSTLNQLTELRALMLALNNFSSTLPDLAPLAPSLGRFNVYGNALTGAIPESLFSLTNLVGFSLEDNKLEGTIPSEVGLMSRLEVFSIRKNNVTGSIPDVWENMPDLFEFSIAFNHIQGMIPHSLTKLRGLERVALNDNPITGTIPSEFGKFEDLAMLEVHHTELVGSMPDEICSLEKRRGTDLLVFGDCDDGRFDCHCCDRCF